MASLIDPAMRRFPCAVRVVMPNECANMAVLNPGIVYAAYSGTSFRMHYVGVGGPKAAVGSVFAGIDEDNNYTHLDFIVQRHRDCSDVPSSTRTTIAFQPKYAADLFAAAQKLKEMVDE